MRERIRSAAREVGRDPAGVELVAVTKSVGRDRAAELLALGALDLGESRPQALEAKARALEHAGPRWHFIGHLQRNKARKVVRLAHAIHSVDSAALLETLARLARETGRTPGVYLQVKLAPDESKGGLAPDEVAALIAGTAGPLPLLGLMTMAPLARDERDQPSVSRPVFDALAALARRLPPASFAGGRVRLSMGMSQDFEEAIRAGADVVRVGSALFEDDAAATAPGRRAG